MHACMHLKKAFNLFQVAIKLNESWMDMHLRGVKNVKFFVCKVSICSWKVFLPLQDWENMLEQRSWL